MSFSDEIKINKLDLDSCSENQVELVDKYGEEFIEALDKKETLKAKLEETEAIIGDEIREDPNSYGLEKITEKGVWQKIVQDSDYKEVQRAYIDAIKEYSRCKNRMSLLDHRRSMLELLTKQWERGYYAEPRRPAPSPETTSKIKRPSKRRQ